VIRPKILARGLLRVQVVLTLTPTCLPVKPTLALLGRQPSWRRQAGHKHVLNLDGDKQPKGGQSTRRSTPERLGQLVDGWPIW
jgi:hypothetical protein